MCLSGTDRDRIASLAGRVYLAARLLWVPVLLSGAHYSPRPLRARDAASQVEAIGRAELIAVNAVRFGRDLNLRGAFCVPKRFLE